VGAEPARDLTADEKPEKILHMKSWHGQVESTVTKPGALP
jgi:hypothetical protein